MDVDKNPQILSLLWNQEKNLHLLHQEDTVTGDNSIGALLWIKKPSWGWHTWLMLLCPLAISRRGSASRPRARSRLKNKQMSTLLQPGPLGEPERAGVSLLNKTCAGLPLQ